MRKRFGASKRQPAHCERQYGPNATAALVGLVLVLGITSLPATASAQQKIQRRIAVNSDVSIKVWIPSGSIRLVGWDKDSLVLEGTIALGSTLFFGGAGAGAKFGVEDATGVKPPTGTMLVAHVPKGARVSVRSVTGSIEAVDVSGTFNTVSGDIRVSGTAQEVNAEAMDGDVRVDANAPYIRARTASGSLTAGGRSEDIAAATVSGALTIDTRGIVQGRFESVTGAITVSSLLDPSAGIEIDSHSGAVELQLASPLTGDLDLTSVTGRITNGLSKNLPVTGSKGKGQQLKVDTGKDGASITVRTFRGPIALRPLR